MIKYIAIIILSISLCSCATSAKSWKEPVYETYIDKEDKKQFVMTTDKDGNKKKVVLYWIHHMRTGFGSDVDFKKETLKAKQDSPLKGIVDITGSKVLGDK